MKNWCRICARPGSIRFWSTARSSRKHCRDVKTGLADLVPVGKMALANPDLVTRLKTKAPLNEANPATFFGGGEAGFTDYPSLAA